jgi:tRNA modification GTPase
LILDRDTIAAVATATGPGAVGMVRISGPGARAILDRVAGASAWEPRRLTLSVVRDEAGDRVDEVLVAYMPAPASFTGEDVVEIHGHGGGVNLARLLAAVVTAGARQAEPGEFTRRAFENGKLDLTQAEGLLAVIEASSERAHRIGQALLGGELGDRVSQARDAVIAELAEVEADIDFPEEGIELARGRGDRLAAVASGLDGLIDSAGLGRAVSEGVTVALVGAVNAGKSSLFNRLVGKERALVAAEPGTTRDYVEAQVVWSGVPVTLIDTAGIREASSAVEARGIALGEGRAREADLELVLVPAAAWRGEAAPASGRRRLVISKADEAPVDSDEVLATSAVDGRGIDDLRSAVVAWATGGAAIEDAAAVVISERQRQRLVAAREAVARAQRAESEARPVELVAADLAVARDELAAVLGQEVGDEVLDRLFARFCIGK